MSNCKYYRDGLCFLATKITGRNIPVSEEDCSSCLPNRPDILNITNTVHRLVADNPPSMVKQAQTYSYAVAQYTASGFQEVPEEVYQERLAICTSCPFYDNNRCSICRCHLGGENGLTSKLRMKGSACADRVNPKWHAYYNGGPNLGTSSLMTVPRNIRKMPVRPVPTNVVDPRVRKQRVPNPKPNTKVEPTGIQWAYGITTVPSRGEKLFPDTLESLAKAGFDKPRLFIDDCSATMASEYADIYQLEVTNRYPRIYSFGNWMLALWELWIRNPEAHRYAIFQDDFVTYPNLRSYLEHVPYPKDGYCNLYTFPKNVVKKPEGLKIGWYRSNQKGLGAVALVFDNNIVEKLIQHWHLAKKPKCPLRGKKSIDGAVVEAVRHMKLVEYVHCPSLVQHTGKHSSMGSPRQALSPTFRGVDTDALDLIKEYNDSLTK